MTIQHFLIARQQAIRFGCWALCLLLFLVLLWPTGIAHAATFTVTNINDSGPGSLRQAILDANARSGADLILFNLGSGVQTIKPTSALPAITDVVEINALSGGDITKWDAILNLPYDRVLTKLLLNKTEAAYQKRYGEMLQGGS